MHKAAKIAKAANSDFAIMTGFQFFQSLAGGMGFMSLVTLGLFLTMSGDSNTALVAFALAGGIFAFLYFNFNPARIFMGDTGSLVLGFVIAVLSVRLIQVNVFTANSILPHIPVFVLVLSLFLFLKPFVYLFSGYGKADHHSLLIKHIFIT